jgi:hypothetical protein
MAPPAAAAIQRSGRLRRVAKRLLVAIPSAVLGFVVAVAVANVIWEVLPPHSYFYSPLQEGMTCFWVMLYGAFFAALSAGVMGGVPGIGWRGVAIALASALVGSATVFATVGLWFLFPYLCFLVPATQVPALLSAWALNRLSERLFLERIVVDTEEQAG